MPKHGHGHHLFRCAELWGRIGRYRSLSVAIGRYRSLSVAIGRYRSLAAVQCSCCTFADRVLRLPVLPGIRRSTRGILSIMGEVIIGYIGTFSESFNVAVLV